MTEPQAGERDDFAAAVRSGLEKPQKVIPARFLYDAAGSLLFEEITGLPEYHLFRTEMSLLEQHGAAIAAAVGPGHALVEFGAGAAIKAPLLLRHLRSAAYVPVDIAPDLMRNAAARLAVQKPELPVHPLVADFTRPMTLPKAIAGTPRLGYLAGSTIGNFAPEAAVDLLRSFRAILGDGALLLLAAHGPEDQASLEAAYDDAAGITASFNRNLLTRLNRELGGNVPLDSFRHRARWNAAHNRMEMHLEALHDVAFQVAGQRFEMRRGETIHTENSYKYGAAELRLLGRAAGWEPLDRWEDKRRAFALHLWQASESDAGP